MKIVIDAMGGDKGPKTVVNGAIESLKESDVNIILTGKQNEIEQILQNSDTDIYKKRIEIVNCTEEITMHDSPLSSIRKKKDSSLVVGVNIVAENKADAFVSAGNTGAIMAAALLKCKLIEGIERPGIAITLPNADNSVTILIDGGANVDCKPEYMTNFAIMGNEYAKVILEKNEPAIGLLSIGEEISKGNELTKNTLKMIENKNFNFLGNVEGKDIFNGRVDVVVCDGFTGNIILKVSESLAENLYTFIKKGIKRNFFYLIGGFFLKPHLMKLKKLINYEEYGGAPLLGIDGYCVICHGKSTVKAIKNAIKISAKFIEQRVNENIVNFIKKSESGSH